MDTNIRIAEPVVPRLAGQVNLNDLENLVPSGWRQKKKEKKKLCNKGKVN